MHDTAELSVQQALLERLEGTYEKLGWALHAKRAAAQREAFESFVSKTSRR